jgi:rare lipoprotein A
MALLTATALLAACAPFPTRDTASSGRASSIPSTGRSKYGNPPSYVVGGHRYYVLPNCSGYDKRGIASWYGSKFHGRRTSSGKPYDMNAMTAAQKTLPLPCKVRVTNLKNGKSLVVTVNDRGPFVKNRLIDLSHAAAAKLGILKTGTGLVEVQSLDTAPLAEPGDSTVVTAAYSAPSASAPATALPSPSPSVANTAPAIYLQVGAFAEHTNAAQVERRLQAAQITPVAIQTKRWHGQILYLVRIGPIAGVTATDSLSERVAQAGLGEPEVVIISQPLAKR